MEPTTLTLEVAQRLVQQALEKAQQDYTKPICVAVCDAQGFQMAFARGVGAPLPGKRRRLAVEGQNA